MILLLRSCQWLFILLLFIGCSASKKSFEKAREFEEAGLYVEAAEYDLDALRKDPKYKEALVHLRKVAPLAYGELLHRADKQETSRNWDEAVAVLRKTDTLVDRFADHGVVLETGRLRQRLLRAQREAAEYHFNNAERFYDDQDWRRAAIAYLKADSFINDYNGSFDKGLDALIRDGDAMLADSRFAEAYEAFTRLQEVAPDHPLVVPKLSETHYRWGRTLFESQDFRAALDHFEKALALTPENAEIETWADAAYREAVQLTAVFPFLNLTRYALDTYFIASEVLTRIQAEQLDFAQFLPFPEVMSLVSFDPGYRDHAYNQAYLLDVATEKGLDSFVWGKVRSMRVDEEPEKFSEHKYDRVTTKTDSSGGTIEIVDTIYYREYRSTRSVRVEVEMYISESGSGNILENQRFDQKIEDTAHWIAYQGSIYDLPEDKRHLLDAPRHPRTVDDMLDSAFRKLSERMANVIRRFYR